MLVNLDSLPKEDRSSNEPDVIKVAFVTAELAPVVKVGGLGDFAFGLTRSLGTHGVDVSVFIPLYRQVGEEYRERMTLCKRFNVQLGWRNHECELYSARVNGVQVFFLKNDYYFDRSSVYNQDDDLERMAYFSKAFIDSMAATGYRPDIIHCNDWHTALIPFMIDVTAPWMHDQGLGTVLTIHNLSYLGVYPARVIYEMFDFRGLEVLRWVRIFSDPQQEEKTIRRLRALITGGVISSLITGIRCADSSVTVSESYSKEMLDRLEWPATENVMKSLERPIGYILNGIDFGYYDPMTDSDLVRNYGSDSIQERDANREALAKELGLTLEDDTFFLGFIGRMVDQKGLDLLIEALPSILERNICFVMMGDGDEKYIEGLKTASGQMGKDRFRLLRFDESLAHRIYSGVDGLLVPSVFEPCGLVQMIAMRYGAVPLVHRVGGLRDTVRDSVFDRTGFLYDGQNCSELLGCIDEAYDVWKNDHAQWLEIQQNCMEEDNDWSARAEEYAELYREVRARRNARLHDSLDPELRSPIGAVKVGTQVTVSIFDHGFDSVGLRVREGNRFYMVPMKKAEGKYTGVIDVPDRGTTIYYDFILTQGPNRYYYGNNVKLNGGRGNLYAFNSRTYSITVYSEEDHPSWFMNCVAYQIFPDSFSRGSDWVERSKNIVDPHWNGRYGRHLIDLTDALQSEYDSDGTIKNPQFYGGTLKGITERLDYISDLGADLIYITPILYALSNHRYDTADYFKIDPILGDFDSFRELVANCEERGIRIMSDGVFNHTGSESKYYDRAGEFGSDGAYGNPGSPYARWYDFIDGSCMRNSDWHGIRSLPRISPNSRDYQNFICGDEGFIEFWMRLGVSSWRLDSADELAPAFIADIRSKAFELNQDSVVIGEMSYDPTRYIGVEGPVSFVNDKRLHGVTNYPLHYAFRYFIAGDINARDFIDRMLTICENYPDQVLLSCFIFLDSHDTARLTTVLQEKYAGEDIGDLYKAAAVMLFSLPGVPLIYYGDETGMKGGKDPDNRRAFPWDSMDTDIHSHFKRLISFYRQWGSLRTGRLSLAAAGESAVIISRESENDSTMAFVNVGAGTITVPVKGGYADMVASGNVSIGEDMLTIGRNSAVILAYGYHGRFPEENIEDSYSCVPPGAAGRFTPPDDRPSDDQPSR